MHVVRPIGYPSVFNTPRHSRHKVTTRWWIPAHKLWQPLEVALLIPTHGADLIAAFNRIPLGKKPFVISFESHLPRLFNYEKTAAFRYFSERLQDDCCRRIIPISQFSRRIFLQQHDASPHSRGLKERLSEVIYPSVEVPTEIHTVNRTDEQLNVLFVGAHFSRKGGPALLLAAKRLNDMRRPVQFHVVSDLIVGGENGVWTDPPEAAFFDEYRPLLFLPNVQMHGKMPNTALLRLMQLCDVSVLPTLCDTFGYSVLESLAAGVPVIATNVSALPELIEPERTGFLLDLDTDEMGEWRHLFKFDQSGQSYRNIYRRTMEDIADQLVNAINQLLEHPQRLSEMKTIAHQTAVQRFDSYKHSSLLDALYDSSPDRNSAESQGILIMKYNCSNHREFGNC